MAKQLTGIPAPVNKDTYETVRALVEAVNQLIKISQTVLTEIEAIKKRLP